MKKIIFILFVLFSCIIVKGNDGYKLWLEYQKVSAPRLVRQYNEAISGIVVKSQSATLKIAESELRLALERMLDKKISPLNIAAHNAILLGTPESSAEIKTMLSSGNFSLGDEGFVIQSRRINNMTTTVIAANKDIGVLYGVFAFIRLIQTHQPINNLSIINVPKIKNRVLNHWDNLNRSVERGYAGISIWNWHTLPGYIDQRYIDYARANASIGINGTVLTNVNANSQVLTQEYLVKVKALADAFRPYGIKVYLTAKFSAPIELGGIKTADPLNQEVINWWKNKCREIYSLIPDFGGFLVKANSEGQPGPQGYGKTHADGANMFAGALEPYGGIVMWRAFVYDVRVQKEGEHFTEGSGGEHTQTIASGDRFKQAYAEFKPLDGQFKKNVLLQVKNGPIDFQPREPFSPLFGAMPQTPLMMEFQITQEYVGQSTTLAYLAPMFKECLDADTYSKGKGSTVARVIDGTIDGHTVSGIAGVANIGNDRNWTGHLFGQANWYAFGRLAWNYDLSPETIAEEWIRQTFNNNDAFINPVKRIMSASREAVINYMTPLGLNHIMGTSHHYGPAPWVKNAGRADWNPVYYHKADSVGIGFDRTKTGSDALAQYAPEVRQQWSDMNTCDYRYLLWFHHVPWNYKINTGSTLWNELCYRYQSGVDTVRWMQQTWDGLDNLVDKERFQHVRMLLGIQEQEAVWWRNACLLYFQTFSKMPFPPGFEEPYKDLSYYQSLKFPLAPGIGGNL
ncbi:alpha-glucuronidase family glycosyl hydrolase [Niabella yanshanensis]|uniref:Xylan alpha-1,2-glucuronidase n=1 Tax=Niabella yanshanensis TaxID=577386 RepID=A0ABZ0W858_9BACT|nr:alpha-glucuronidase family glycosyl hydrolase [Niabella yanshanensis]WQD38714.1 alpha-glucuronidase family glycosyl hydrolase [Niabella yanshanensis]